ncbi:MAG: TlpA family protein disulfide reductase [Lactobacillaceae bacterium]|nr:TlpA family protein disulfide reductase [Lactobacillaceae bacterium]
MIGFFIVFYTSGILAKQDAVNIYEAPRKLPVRTIYYEGGKKVFLSDYKGEFLIVVFWSKKCAVCIRELDDLNNFSNIVKDSGIRVIAISPASEWTDFLQTKAFLRRWKAPDLEVYLDEGGGLAADFGVHSTPHNVLINKKGEEIGRIRGGADWDDPEIIEYIYRIKAKHG